MATHGSPAISPTPATSPSAGVRSISSCVGRRRSWAANISGPYSTSEPASTRSSRFSRAVRRPRSWRLATASGRAASSPSAWRSADRGPGPRARRRPRLADVAAAPRLGGAGGVRPSRQDGQQLTLAHRVADGDLEAPEHPVTLGDELMLHLHRLEHDDRRARGDGLARARAARETTVPAKGRQRSSACGLAVLLIARYFGAMSDAAELLWEPSAERVQRATLTRYMEWLEPSAGWLRRLRGAVAVVGGRDRRVLGVDRGVLRVRFGARRRACSATRTMPGAEWFPGSRISYAEHIFRGKDDDAVAIRHASELRPLEAWTWGELRVADGGDRRRACAALGVRRGRPGGRLHAEHPRDGGGFLACASIGAIWSSAAPEFGARSVIDRFAQVEPKVLLAVDGYRYGGKDFDRARDRGADRRGDPVAGARGAVRLPGRERLGGRLPRARDASCRSRRCRSTTRCGCSTARARPGCPSRSCTARAGSCSSRSRR